MKPSSRDWLSRRGAAGLWALIGVTCVIAVMAPAVSLPSNARTLRRFQVPLDGAAVVSQTFTMTADGLDAIEVAFAGSAGASGSVRLELYERSSLQRWAEATVSELTAGPYYRFQFEPISDSRDATFTLDVSSARDDPGRGVAVWATKGGSRNGTMLLDGRERWANLIFAAHAPAGASSWQRLRDASADSPRRWVTGIVIGALAVYWCALGIVLVAFRRFPDANGYQS